MMIDAHQHFWRLARGDYGWLTADLGAIYRDFDADDLAPLLARHGIAASLLVQAAPTEAETVFLLETAARTPFVAGVVGWADFDSPDCPARIRRVAGDRLLVGLRPMLQDIVDDSWIARVGHRPVLEALIEQGLVFDALVRPRHLVQVRMLAEHYAALTIVLDHLAKPAIISGELDPWRQDVRALAACPNVVCKLSGMVTEAGTDWTVERLRPFAEVVIDAFGPERVMWGSDWPVVERAGSYDRWRNASIALLAGLSPQQQADILGGTAKRVYLSGRRGRLPC